MALTTRDLFANCMRDLIEIRIRDLTEELTYGAAVTTYEAYRERVGQIKGLKNALDLMEEADAKVNRVERGK